MAEGRAYREVPQAVPRIADVPEVERNLPTPESGAGRPPIVVLFGPQGIGKSTLLIQLSNNLNKKTPRALVDCARYGEADVPKLLTYVKLQFGRHCPGIGRVTCRRLEIGLAASREPIAFGGNPRHASRRLIDLILQEIYVFPKDIGDVLSDAAGEILSGRWILLRTLLGRTAAVASRLLSRRMLLWLLRRSWRWYGHRDQHRNDEVVHELADLNTWAHDPNGHDRRDERLIEAFLADVRDAFSRGRLARPGWFNCVLLLDNADTEVGEKLLRHLHALRRSLQIARAPVEPLLVVATGRRPLHGEFLDQRRMPDFTESETVWLAEHLPSEVDHRFSKVLHQFTGGYPDAAAFLTAAAARRPDVAAHGLDALLAARLDTGEQTVEERLFREVTDALSTQLDRPLPDEAFDHFATCALARTQEDADWLAQHHVDGAIVGPQLLAETDLWNDADRTGAHDLLRLLLLRQLGERTADDSKPDWATVCGSLGDHRRQLGDLRGELYYSLARNDFDTVVRRLAECLSGPSVDGTWLELLKFVTKAPRRLAQHAASPYEQQVSLAATVVDDGMTHLMTTARLVAGLWLVNDPCTLPDREDLHEQIHLDFKQVAPYADRPVDLRNEARRHQVLAHDWS